MLKSIQLSQNILKSSGLSSQISEILKSQEGITKSLSGFNMMAEIAKSIQFQKMFVGPDLSAIEARSKSISHQIEFAIPQTTIDSISSINRQHEQFISGIRALAETVRIQSPVLRQFNELNFALNRISGQIAALAAQQRNWAVIDDYEEITGQAIEFSESLTEEVTEEQQRQFQVLLTLVSAFIKKYGVQAYLIIDIILRFAGFHQYYDFLKEKPVLATKAEVHQISNKQDSISHFIQILSEQLKQTNDYRITNRHCDVKLKPKTKTLTVSRLPKDFELVVLQVNHKWVLVSFFDPKDNLPQTGWVMKKYLSRPAL
ncbi:hypothetical protein [Algoriphagus ratkowskyi]|nr:hypothetical protein [Algoriphagus ratkowskyi]TXD79274.1 hypothetical protein ESW18_03300 [Algoriphagus ratkowskyi]